jgi:hypothetical protein
MKILQGIILKFYKEINIRSREGNRTRGRPNNLRGRRYPQRPFVPPRQNGNI